MSNQEFDIIFRGDIVFGHQLADVKQRLQQLFKADAAKVDALFSGRPVPLKRGLDQASAEKYKEALTRAGAQVDIVPGGETKPVSVSVARPLPTPPASTSTPIAAAPLTLAQRLEQQAAAAEKEDRPVRRPTSELVPITLQEDEEVSPPKEDLSKPQAEQAAVWTPSPQKRLSGGMALFLGIAIGAAIVVVGLGLLFLLRNNG